MSVLVGKFCWKCKKIMQWKDGVRILEECYCNCEIESISATPTSTFIGSTKYNLDNIPVQMMNPQLDQLRCIKGMEKQGKLSNESAKYWKKRLGHIVSYNYKNEINPHK